MKSVTKHKTWSAGLLGAINGVLFALAVSPFRDAYDKWDYCRMLEIFNGVPPLMGRMIKPWFEVVTCAFIFALASILANSLWRKRVNSTIVFWQLVAILAVIGTFTLDYVYNRASRWIEAIQWRLERGHWGYLPQFAQDLSFPLLILVVAVSFNFFFGAVIQILETRYPKRFRS
ncbi:MAG: hypothetical protein LC746_08035 [Acidobacteria bacterium]|nr:hypothetical protein [Acidobacteriota bacterium]